MADQEQTESRSLGVHPIRLRGPWQYQVLEQTAGEGVASPTGRQKLPADWSAVLGSEFRGRVRYRRVFHQPTGLEAGQGVWLVVDEVHACGELTLNGEPLGVIEQNALQRLAIEHLLQPTNELLVEVAQTERQLGPGGVTGEVRLEIQVVRPRPVD